MLSVSFTVYRFVCDTGVFTGLFSEDEEGRRIPDTASFCCCWSVVPRAAQGQFNPADLREPNGVSAHVYFKPHHEDMTLTFACAAQMRLPAADAVLSFQLRPSEYDGGEIPVVANGMVDPQHYLGKPKKNYAVKLRDASSQVIGKLLFSLHVEPEEEADGVDAAAPRSAPAPAPPQPPATTTVPAFAAKPVYPPFGAGPSLGVGPDYAQRQALSPSRTSNSLRGASLPDDGYPSFRNTPAPRSPNDGEGAAVYRPIPQRTVTAPASPRNDDRSGARGREGSGAAAAARAEDSIPLKSTPVATPEVGGNREALELVVEKLSFLESIAAKRNSKTKAERQRTGAGLPPRQHQPQQQPQSQPQPSSVLFPRGSYVLRVREGPSVSSTALARTSADGPEVLFHSERFRLPMSSGGSGSDRRLRFGLWQDNRQAAGFSVEMGKLNLKPDTWKAYTIPFRHRLLDKTAALNVSVRHCTSTAAARAAEAVPEQKSLDTEDQELTTFLGKWRPSAVSVSASAAAGGATRRGVKEVTTRGSSRVVGGGAPGLLPPSPPRRRELSSSRQTGDGDGDRKQVEEQSAGQQPATPAARGSNAPPPTDLTLRGTTQSDKARQPPGPPCESLEEQQQQQQRTTPLRSRQPPRRPQSPSPLQPERLLPRQRLSASRLSSPGQQRSSPPVKKPTPAFLSEHDKYLSAVMEQLQQRQRGSCRRSLKDEWEEWRDDVDRSRSGSRNSSVGSRGDSVASAYSRRSHTPGPTKSLSSFLTPDSKNLPGLL